VVINQVNKSWDRNKENMDAYCLEVRKLENKFYSLEFHHVVRDNNVAADVLSKLGSTRAQVPVGVFIHELHVPSIPEPAPMITDPAPSSTGQEVMMIDVVGVLDRNLPRVVPEVDECGLVEIGNSKEETRGTQFRQGGSRGA
jgi:hypothetical protein